MKVRVQECEVVEEGCKLCSLSLSHPSVCALWPWPYLWDCQIVSIVWATVRILITTYYSVFINLKQAL